MKKPSKRFQECQKKVDQTKVYTLEQAVSTLKGLPHVKFDETVEIACNLNIDPKQAEQMVRASIVLPHGLGKIVRVVVFCKGEQARHAREAGADFVGALELIQKIKDGWLEFDQTVSSPEMMKDVAQLGKILGPRGLMPSPKSGTVGSDVAGIVKDLKAGKIQFRSDKTGNIHAVAGKISFSVQDICENAAALIKAILAVRPPAVKGRYLRSLNISTSMGPGLRLDAAKLSVT